MDCAGFADSNGRKLESTLMVSCLRARGRSSRIGLESTRCRPCRFLRPKGRVRFTMPPAPLTKGRAMHLPGLRSNRSRPDAPPGRPSTAPAPRGWASSAWKSARSWTARPPATRRRRSILSEVPRLTRRRRRPSSLPPRSTRSSRERLPPTPTTTRSSQWSTEAAGSSVSASITAYLRRSPAMPATSSSPSTVPSPRPGPGPFRQRPGPADLSNGREPQPVDHDPAPRDPVEPEHHRPQLDAPRSRIRRSGGDQGSLPARHPVSPRPLTFPTSKPPTAIASATPPPTACPRARPMT